MRCTITTSGVSVWLSARDTYGWAHKSGAAWPCSFLSDRRVGASFDSDGLADLTIDGGRGDQECPSDELSACIADHLADRLPSDHPCYGAVVGQFLPA